MSCHPNLTTISFHTNILDSLDLNSKWLDYIQCLKEQRKTSLVLSESCTRKISVPLSNVKKNVKKLVKPTWLKILGILHTELIRSHHHEKHLLGRSFEQIWFYPNVDTVLISNLLQISKLGIHMETTMLEFWYFECFSFLLSNKLLKT